MASILVSMLALTVSLGVSMKLVFGRYDIENIVKNVENEDIPIRFRQMSVSMLILPAFLASLTVAIINNDIFNAATFLLSTMGGLSALISVINGFRFSDIDRFNKIYIYGVVDE